MFINVNKKQEYLKENEVIYNDINKLPVDYFQVDEKGNLLLDTKKCYKSERNVESYATCIGWIMLDSGRMALIKNFFGDIYRNRLSVEDYNLSKYNNILIPEIARQLQNNSAQYYFIKKEESNNTYLLTMNFLDMDSEEKLIEGNDILLDSIKDEIEGKTEEESEDIQVDAVAELEISKILEKLEIYLINNNCCQEDIDTVKRDFIKQSILNKFIKQSDENNGNWGIIRNRDNRYRIAPIYDVDCSCGINKMRKKQRICSNKQTDIESLITQYKDLPWMKKYIEEVINNFDIQKAFTNSKQNTNIEIEENIKDRYISFFDERIEELKKIYCKKFNENTKEKEEERQ